MTSSSSRVDINSMTGFGRGSAGDGRLEVVVELTSVNKRNLEVSVSLTKQWQSLEHFITDQIRHAVLRGRLHVSVQVEELLKEGEELSWEEAKVSQTLQKLAALAQKQSVPFHPDANLLLQVVSSSRPTSLLPTGQEVQPLVKKALGEAIDALLVMRKEEGATLAESIKKQTDHLTQWLKEIRAETAGLVSHYRESLFQRLKQAGLDLDLNDERLLKELALFADRCDISEEILRLESHFKQFRKSFENAGPVGRKLEFILQEIHREFNTIGSKANSIEISKRVIEAKNTIERIREQLQNVE